MTVVASVGYVLPSLFLGVVNFNEAANFESTKLSNTI